MKALIPVNLTTNQKGYIGAFVLKITANLKSLRIFGASHNAPGNACI
jgi:hypothetical protein